MSSRLNPANAPLSESALQYAIYLLNLAAVAEMVRSSESQLSGALQGRAADRTNTKPQLETLLLATIAPPIDDSGSRYYSPTIDCVDYHQSAILIAQLKVMI